MAYTYAGYKWNGNPFGSPGGNVTWSIDSTVPASFENDLQGAFTWSQYGNITFTELIPGAAANIVFTYGLKDGPGNQAGVATVFSSSGAIISVSILIDNAEGWTEDVNGVATSSFSNVRLSTVALHEVGHGIGLAHDTTTGSIMSPVADPNINTLQTDDIQGVQAIYGAVCYCTGTRIRTVRGDVAVEALRVGDLAVTSSGAHRPIRWIGHRSLDLRGHPQPDQTQPVRIAAHAFGENRPVRDLRVSPWHAICLDLIGEVMIPAFALINGSTVVQESVESVTYWHVELDSHDVLLAEGLPAESYLDMGNRAFFAESRVVALTTAPGTAAAAHGQDGYCRPFHAEGPVAAFARARLAARARQMGWRQEAVALDEDVRLVADGQVLRAQSDGLALRFVVPVETRELHLVSGVSLAAEPGPDGRRRRLGISLATLRIDDGLAVAHDLALDDPRLGAGFHPCDRDLENGWTWRWTDGAARLPASLWAGCRGVFFLRLLLAGPPPLRWIAPDRAVPAAAKPALIPETRAA